MIDCPLIPSLHSVNLSFVARYREAGAEVIDVLCRFCKCVERASIDEAYLDVTEEVNQRMSSAVIDPCLLPHTHVVGYENKEQQKDNKGTFE